MSSEDLHVSRERLSPEGRILHYAIASLREELEAVDWYRQRADDTEDRELREILLHNMREEMEHASMLLEWLHLRADHGHRRGSRERALNAPPARSARMAGPSCLHDHIMCMLIISIACTLARSTRASDS